MALVTEQVPEHRREGAALVAVELELLGTLLRLGIVAAHGGDARQVAFDVGHEDRHAGRREAFGDGLQAHGLAGAGGARDQAVAIAVFQEQVLVGLARADQDRCVVCHGRRLANAADAFLPIQMGRKGA